MEKEDCILPSGRYFPVMAEKLLVRSAVPKFLARQRLTVADLVRRMEDGGFRVDKKTIYRLASDAPVRNLNLPVMAAIGRVLKVSDPGKLIDWSTASGQPPQLKQIEANTQARLDELMGKNTEGILNAAERRELDKLGKQVEKISLENAHLLAAHSSAARRAIGEKRRGMSGRTRRRPASA